jgi:pyruvate/2-oxoglutarate dehydrogenase complex dihydrolipoamide acyltransferase (E2) component
MTVTIAMPQLGLTMTEATVGAWLKKPGDAVRKDEPLLSISTDKVDMDIESNVDGILRDILVEEGKTVPVGTPLALVDAVGEASSTPAPAPVPPADAAQRASVDAAQIDGALEKDEASETLRSSPRSSPRARREARRLGIDIATVKGSGPDGRIVEKDLPDPSDI